MKCTNCGANLRDGAGFCSSCGQAVVKAIFCRKCGVELEMGDKFCYACGAEVKAAAQPAKSADIPAEAPKAVPHPQDNEPSDWAYFANLWNDKDIHTLGAGSTKDHYLLKRGQLVYLSAGSTTAKSIKEPSGVDSFCAHTWKNSKLFLSAKIKEQYDTKIQRLYTYTEQDGFHLLLDIKNLFDGQAEIARFIVTGNCIYLLIYAKNEKNTSHLLTCGLDGSNVQDIWEGEYLEFTSAGQGKLFALGRDTKGKEIALFSHADDSVEEATAVLEEQLLLIAKKLDRKLAKKASDRAQFCKDHIKFIDFTQNMIYFKGYRSDTTYQIPMSASSEDEIKEFSTIWGLGELFGAFHQSEYFDGKMAIGYKDGCWTALYDQKHMPAWDQWNTEIPLGDSDLGYKQSDQFAVLGNHMYLNRDNTWYRIDLKSGKFRELSFID